MDSFDIAHEFVQQYYENLSNTPENMHNFYLEDGKLSWFHEPEQNNQDFVSDADDAFEHNSKDFTVVGTKAIKQKFEELFPANFQVDIDSINCQEVHPNSYLIVATGALKLKPSEPFQLFTQSVLLTNNYVKNDLVRFMSRRLLELAPALSAVPAKVPTPKQTTPKKPLVDASLSDTTKTAATLGFGGTQTPLVFDDSATTPTNFVLSPSPAKPVLSGVKKLSEIGHIGKPISKPLTASSSEESQQLESDSTALEVTEPAIDTAVPAAASSPKAETKPKMWVDLLRSSKPPIDSKPNEVTTTPVESKSASGDSAGEFGLYIQNLPSAYQSSGLQKEIETIFSKFGTITSFEFKKPYSCYVNYDSLAAVEAALTAANAKAVTVGLNEVKIDRRRRPNRLQGSDFRDRKGFGGDEAGVEEEVEEVSGAKEGAEGEEAELYW
eukprot:CAMPEP_0175150554 /NCGR_PEP_ID=MMETSP0087-20121206/17956_1 /TAXON_ID=136419 /ORGANISM="Unknown Unknown, Strain D1" /LENGTH=438 /DNA_ID=CAMNT_0016436555 /DNA_START=15 /DNA_END=1329 /DNA_ORIENTATION=+